MFWKCRALYVDYNEFPGLWLQKARCRDVVWVPPTCRLNSSNARARATDCGRRWGITGRLRSGRQLRIYWISDRELRVSRGRFRPRCRKNRPRDTSSPSREEVAKEYKFLPDAASLEGRRVTGGGECPASSVDQCRPSRVTARRRSAAGITASKRTGSWWPFATRKARMTADRQKRR